MYYWAIPEKIQTGGEGGVEDIEFPGVSKEQRVEFPSLIKNEVTFPRVAKKK